MHTHVMVHSFFVGETKKTRRIDRLVLAQPIEHNKLWKRVAVPHRNKKKKIVSYFNPISYCYKNKYDVIFLLRYFNMLTSLYALELLL